MQKHEQQLFRQGIAFAVSEILQNNLVLLDEYIVQDEHDRFYSQLHKHNKEASLLRIFLDWRNKRAMNYFITEVLAHSPFAQDQVPVGYRCFSDEVEPKEVDSDREPVKYKFLENL